MNWIVPILSIYLGFVQPGGFIGGIDQPVLETSITSGVLLFNHIGIENDIDVYSDFPSDNYFSPYHVDFTIRGYVEFDGLEIGYQHACFHPISPTDYERSYTGAYDKIYLKYDARFNQ